MAIRPGESSACRRRVRPTHRDRRLPISGSLIHNQTGEYTEEDWQAEIARFDAVMTGWRELLESADESKLAELVPNKGDTTWAETIGLINTRNAYHGGQILVLRKLHGNWDPEKGVS